MTYILYKIPFYTEEGKQISEKRGIHFQWIAPDGKIFDFALQQPKNGEWFLCHVATGCLVNSLSLYRPPHIRKHADFTAHACKVLDKYLSEELYNKLLSVLPEAEILNADYPAYHDK